MTANKELYLLSWPGKLFSTAKYFFHFHHRAPKLKATEKLHH